MRGGAIPIVCWATILLVLAIGNAVWDSKLVNGIEAGAASLIIYAIALGLWLASRDSLRRGPPPSEEEVEAIPTASTGAVCAGLAAATLVFGLAWSRFFVFLGAGALIVALGRVAIELRSERATAERAREGQEPQ